MNRCRAGEDFPFFFAIERAMWGRSGKDWIRLSYCRTVHEKSMGAISWDPRTKEDRCRLIIVSEEG